MRTVYAQRLCGLLDALPGPVIDDTEQLSVLAVAVEALFAAIARVPTRVNGRHGPVRPSDVDRGRTEQGGIPFTNFPWSPPCPGDGDPQRARG